MYMHLKATGPGFKWCIILLNIFLTKLWLNEQQKRTVSLKSGKGVKTLILALISIYEV